MTPPNSTADAVTARIECGSAENAARIGARRDVIWCGKTFVGALFLGWGSFNFVEGVIDHHLLHIHHVMERLGPSLFDYAFLALGLVFIAGGWMAITSARREVRSSSGGAR